MSARHSNSFCHTFGEPRTPATASARMGSAPSIEKHSDQELSAPETTSSIWFSDMCEGSHNFTIRNYSLAKGLGIGNCISSDTFHVGRCSWKINFYPDGFAEHSADYIAVYLVLVAGESDKMATFKLFLLNQREGKKHMVLKQQECIKFQGMSFTWGCDKFMRHVDLEASEFLKDDSLQIGCKICIAHSQKTLKITSIIPPPSNIARNLLHLWESGKEADVNFDVDGYTFSAHKLILGARSSVFNAQFYGSLNDEGVNPIKIEEMEASVFKVLLHFIYSDDLPDLNKLKTTSPTSVYEHLIVAADRYDLDRLKLICVTHLNEKISVVNVIALWVLAERHHVYPLKSCCLEFVASHNNLRDVMQSTYFHQIKVKDQSMIADFMQCVLSEMFSSHSNRSPPLSVEAQFATTASVIMNPPSIIEKQPHKKPSLPGHTYSIWPSELLEGYHHFTIKNYSLAKGLGVGKCIVSDKFDVGGCFWQIKFYPDGRDNCVADYISVYVALTSGKSDKRANFKLCLLDQSKVKNHLVFKLPHATNCNDKNFTWGFDKFINRNSMEASSFLKDDCLQIGCNISFVQSQKARKISSIISHPSNITPHLLQLLESGNDADVHFDVNGEHFAAHKLIIGARSSVFKDHFHGSLDDLTIKVEEIEASVFKILLHFVYSDELPDLDKLTILSHICVYKHLIVAADRYDLYRLKLLSAFHLSKNISVDNVTGIWLLAERHNLSSLKSCCLEFIVIHDNLQAVMQNIEFQRIKESEPSKIALFLQCLFSLRFL